MFDNLNISLYDNGITQKGGYKMKSYFIKYRLFVGDWINCGEQHTSIMASKKDIAINKLERKLKKQYCLAFRHLEIMTIEIGGYY
jgi:hypothetical protein